MASQAASSARVAGDTRAVKYGLVPRKRTILSCNSRLNTSTNRALRRRWSRRPTTKSGFRNALSQALVSATTRHGRAGTGLRDTLLPQLLSGRLTVRQAAKLVG